MRDPTETEKWLANWLNQNASSISNYDFANVPILTAFMLPALAEAIDKRAEKNESGFAS